MNKNHLILASILLVLCQLCSTAWATQYIYDDNGRIARIIDNQGRERLVNQSMFQSETNVELQSERTLDSTREQNPRRNLNTDNRVENPAVVASPRKTLQRGGSDTITSMRPNGFNGSYAPYLPIFVTNNGAQYTLSNGGTFSSGSSSFTEGRMLISSVEVVGDQITYTFIPFGTDPLLAFYDFGNSGTSTEGILAMSGPATMQATVGSTTGVMTGGLEIIANQPGIVSAENFASFTSIEGSVIPFQMNMSLINTTWTEFTFDSPIDYSTTDIEFGFDNPISQPVVESLRVGGTAQIPPNTEVSFNALLTYEGGYEANASSSVQWSVEPDGVVTIDNLGVIATGPAPIDDVPLTITAQFQQFTAQTSTLLIGNDTLETARANDWSSYQGGSEHTGYVPVQIEDSDFNIKWETNVSGANTFQQIVSSGDKIYAISRSNVNTPQLYALDAKNGQILWSKYFGSVDSVDQAATAYGNVYFRTGYVNNSNSDIFYALNGDTGEEIFSKPFPRTFDDFAAPVIEDGSVYLFTEESSGLFGDLHRFDAFSGESDWMANLRVESFHSPTVIGSRVFSHSDQYFQAVDIDSGELVYTIQDPNYTNSSIYGRAVVQASDDTALAVIGDNLVKFNLQSPPRIEWSVVDFFRSELAVAENVVYIATVSELRAYDLSTGALLWSWNSGSNLFGNRNIAATKTHVFLPSSSNTYVIDVGTKNLVATIPRGGTVSIANEHLYIASGSGRVTAVELPAVIEAPPESLAISGLDQLAEFSSANYQLSVVYADGSVRDRTALTSWSLKSSEVATINSTGTLSVGRISSPQITASINAEYSEDGIALSTSKTINLFTELTNSEFSLRSLDDALMIELSILQQLEDARRNLESARNGVIDEMSGDAQTALEEIDQAIDARQRSYDELLDSVNSVENAINILNGTTPIRSTK